VSDIVTQRLTILGSTGSIGVNTLDVVGRHPGHFEVIALTASSQWQRMLEQCRQWRPRYAVMADPEAAAALTEALAGENGPTRVLAGIEGLREVSTLPDVDAVMAGIVGAAGLLPTLDAVRAGKRVMIANKEPLVMMGETFVSEAQRTGAILLPIDSEHNAIFQCLPPVLQERGATPGKAGLPRFGIRRILLTGSGGPFLRLERERFAAVTPEQACAHPNWVMGRKISVDSATMMNKGLELIEACNLFDTTPGHIEIVVHPQSVIHSMVEYVDGSILAQLGNPDMRTPIAHALGWPQRIDSGVEPLDLLRIASLDFEEPDLARFPALDLARTAAESGGTQPAILNAANEEAVAAFLDGRLSFAAIPELVARVMTDVAMRPQQDLASVLEADAEARARAAELLAERGFTPATYSL